MEVTTGPDDALVHFLWRPLRSDDETGPVPSWQPVMQESEDVTRGTALDTMKERLPGDPRLYQMIAQTKVEACAVHNHVLWVAEGGSARLVVTDDRRWRDDVRLQLTGIIDEYPWGGSVVGLLEREQRGDWYMVMAAVLMDRDHRRAFFDACRRITKESGSESGLDALRALGTVWSASVVAAFGRALSWDVPGGVNWIRERFTPDMIFRHAHAVEHGALLGRDLEGAVPDGW